MQTRSKNRFSQVSPMRESLNSSLSSTSLTSSQLNEEMNTNQASSSSTSIASTRKTQTTARRGTSRQSRSRSRSKGRKSSKTSLIKVYTRKELNDEKLTNKKEDDSDCIVIDDSTSTNVSKLNSRRSTRDSCPIINQHNDSVDNLLREINKLVSTENLNESLPVLETVSREETKEESRVLKRESSFVKEKSLVKSSTPLRMSLVKESLHLTQPTTSLPTIQEDNYYHSGYLRFSLKTIVLIAFVTLMVICLLFLIDNKLTFAKSASKSLETFLSIVYEKYLLIYDEVYDKL